MSSAAASAWHRFRTRLPCPEERSRCLGRCPRPSLASRHYRALGHMTRNPPVHGSHRRSPPDYGGCPRRSYDYSVYITSTPRVIPPISPCSRSANARSRTGGTTSTRSLYSMRLVGRHADVPQAAPLVGYGKQGDAAGLSRKKYRAQADHARGIGLGSSRLCVVAALLARPGCALEGDAVRRDEKADSGRGALACASGQSPLPVSGWGRPVPVRW